VLPGCIATGHTIKETEQEVRAAIEFHIEGVREDGLAAPQPTSIVEYLDIAVTIQHKGGRSGFNPTAGATWQVRRRVETRPTRITSCVVLFFYLSMKSS
ncbi:MAG: type II toxin-antitoxin system HicB family antitoxin, partial [Chlorobium sp.]|nr:type II toxin-antitoxin system HicB family antitoxin [Chlorobium sp.]